MRDSPYLEHLKMRKIKNMKYTKEGKRTVIKKQRGVNTELYVYTTKCPNGQSNGSGPSQRKLTTTRNDNIKPT